MITPSQFRLDQLTLSQLDQVALHLGQQAGRPVTRTAALRDIIAQAAKKLGKKIPKKISVSG